MLRLLRMLALTAAPMLCADTVFRYGRFEASFTSAGVHENPIQDVAMVAHLSGPEGVRATVPAFWDGGKTWRLRFSPEKAGRWTYRTSVTRGSDSGLDQQTGEFQAAIYKGPNVLYSKGAPRVSPDHRYFVHGDGTPWFWLACTGWNSALLSTDEEWGQYIADRLAKRFTAIQLVMEAPWRAGRKDERGNVAFTGADSIRIHPEFFQRMDRRMETLADRGLVAVAVMLWALTSKERESPGEVLPESQAALLAGYMKARYDAFPVIWMLGGDGDYRGAKAERWKAIGRAVFPPDQPHRPVSLHPRGTQNPWPDLKDEAWIDYFNYQTGHGGDERKWKWNATEGTASGWKIEPPRPVLDSEPNYEAHISYAGGKIDDYAVRKASYYSLLAAPVAGITYGAHGIWPWLRERVEPLDHARSGPGDPWTVCLNYPGARQMKVLRDIFDQVQWWKLRPERSLLANDPPPASYANWPMPALTTDRREAVLYLPERRSVELNLAGMEGSPRLTWWNPRDGKATKIQAKPRSGKLTVEPPADGDWVLVAKQR